MRLYRISFVTGFAAGFVAGTRAGREKYDQMVQMVKTARENPTVQQAASTVQAQATSVLSSAGQKVADTAPKVASSAMHKAGDRIPLLRSRNGHAPSNGKTGAEKDRPFAGTNSTRHSGQDNS
jgi:hypothetical protein